MKNIILITTFLIGFLGYSQDDAEIKYSFRASKFIQQKWEYFMLQEIIEVKIIQHIPAKVLCGTVATASMTIVENKNGETLRILDLCNLSPNYKTNQIIKVLPTSKPQFNVSLPFEFKKNTKTNKIESKSKNYDLIVLKTTWGNLEN